MVVVCILFLIILAYLYYQWLKMRGDVILLIDKTKRWDLVYTNLKGKDKWDYKGNTYILDDQNGICSKKGKVLFLFSEGNPQSTNLGYSSSSIDGKTLMKVINNELIRLMVKTRESFKDTLLLFGAIGGILAGIASVLILLKQFGILR